MSVTASINYIAPRAEGNVEKPYHLKFEPPDGFPATNIRSREYSTTIRDVRGRESLFSVATNGFAVMKVNDRLDYEDYDNETLIRQVYFKDLAVGLQRMLEASRVQIFEHVIRKRHAAFPIATGEAYKFNQPTNTAHVDVTPAWAQGTAEHLNQRKACVLPSENFQFVNIWKPLRGPVKDWPLGICDSSTVSHANVRDSDIVFSDRVVENQLLEYNHNQRWYYLSDQMPNEAWVFLQSDSLAQGLPGTPHSSFLHPDHIEGDTPRESIEVRAIVYFENGR